MGSISTIRVPNSAAAAMALAGAQRAVQDHATRRRMPADRRLDEEVDGLAAAGGVDNVCERDDVTREGGVFEHAVLFA
jgi:hypothetical protein